MAQKSLKLTADNNTLQNLILSIVRNFEEIECSGEMYFQINLIPITLFVL